MIEQTTSQDAHKKGLQRQIRRTRDSLRDTVEQIQDTAEQNIRQLNKQFRTYSIIGRNSTKSQLSGPLVHFAQDLLQARQEQERLTVC
jgi:ABC-type phosphate transport system auxiliary subunit